MQEKPDYQTLGPIDYLFNRFRKIRNYTTKLCAPLAPEDFVVQPIVDVSPPKWHLGHTTWFFENFILVPNHKGYKLFNKRYNYIFNSYYENAGDRILRSNRGNLSRPLLKDVLDYRKHVDQHLVELIGKLDLDSPLLGLIELGLQHEQQHQELLITDLKYIFGNNPLFPVYQENDGDIISEFSRETCSTNYEKIDGGIYQIGHQGNSFCYDNELGIHDVYIKEFSSRATLITNREFLEFINDKGYENHNLWLSEGFEWVKKHNITAPEYWFRKGENWVNYTLTGIKPIVLDAPVCHVSYYEADAFAQWKGERLATEFEREVSSKKIDSAGRWEWTNSAYLPYPGFKKADGALGEYNGKFMVNQMVLKGASTATSIGHSRPSYRNFFHPQLRWQYTGIRLTKNN